MSDGLDLPGEGAKSHAGLLGLVPAESHADESTSSNGEGNKASEPEQHGQSIQTQDNEAMGETLGKARGQDLPKHNENTPEGHEDHEGDLRGHKMEVEAVTESIGDTAICPEAGNYRLRISGFFTSNEA